MKDQKNLSNLKSKITVILVTILGIALIILGSLMIEATIPMLKTITNYCSDDKFFKGCLWFILLLFDWGIGLSTIIFGILFFKIKDI